MHILDEPKSIQNGSADNLTQNGPVVPNRTIKPPFSPSSTLTKEEQSQIHLEAVAVMEKARQEQEKRLQERRHEEEKRERELKERLEREKRMEEDEEKKRQEKKKLERQKAEEKEDKENRVYEERDGRGKESNTDTPSKSMSLDSPAPNHIVSEIKVGLFTCRLPQMSFLKHWEEM